jgi:hypothetical protein
MSPKLRRLTYLCAVLLVAAVGTGCSKKTTKPPPVPPIAHEDSDDLVQQVAMMTSIDHGGWLTDLQSTVASVPQFAPGPQPSLTQRVIGFSANPRSPVGVNRDTTFTSASMNFSAFYYYTDTQGDSLGAWADTVTQVDARITATGTLSATGFSAYYRHVGDPVTGLGFEAGSDTVTFTGAGEDSLFATFTPKLRTGTRYFSTTGFLDFDITMFRNPALNALPLEGTTEYFLFGDVLNSANPSDINKTVEATVTMHFNGTAVATVDVTDESVSETPLYHYTLNLQTGDFARLP